MTADPQLTKEKIRINCYPRLLRGLGDHQTFREDVGTLVELEFPRCCGSTSDKLHCNTTKKNEQGKLTNDPRESIYLKGIVIHNRVRAIVFSCSDAKSQGGL